MNVSSLRFFAPWLLVLAACGDDSGDGGSGGGSSSTGDGATTSTTTSTSTSTSSSTSSSDGGGTSAGGNGAGGDTTAGTGGAASLTYLEVCNDVDARYTEYGEALGCPASPTICEEPSMCGEELRAVFDCLFENLEFIDCDCAPPDGASLECRTVECDDALTVAADCLGS